MTNNSHYSSGLGAILTMIGVAVGLGNVWRFPYMMGSYGGSAFLLIYLIFTLFFAFPALVSEMALGKTVRTGTIKAYESLFGKHYGVFLGYFLVAVITISGSYYAVVVANVWFSTAYSLFSGFSVETNSNYAELLGDGRIQYGTTIFLIIIALSVSWLGLQKGIERLSRIIMPFFLFSILYMIGYAWVLPGAMSKVKLFLFPDFNLVGPTEIFAALGQAFFSLGLGGTFVVVYSGFLSEKQNITKIAAFTAVGDLGASFLVSLFLVPTILVLGLKMNAGPALIFNTLPELFSILPAGRWIGSLFLFALSLVAFLSLVAAFQVPLNSLGFVKISAKKMIIGFGILQLLLAFPSAFYPSIIGTLDLVFGSGMQVFGSMLAIGGVWWGIKSGFYRSLLFKSPGKIFASSSVFWLRWIIPGTLLAVLIGYIYSSLT